MGRAAAPSPQSPIPRCLRRSADDGAAARGEDGGGDGASLLPPLGPPPRAPAPPVPIPRGRAGGAVTTSHASGVFPQPDKGVSGSALRSRPPGRSSPSSPFPAGSARTTVACAPRGRARRDRPHPQPLSPAAAADRGRYPWGSGVRVSRPGPPGPPSPPNPLSRRRGRGGETGPGEGLALPPTPRLPRRGGLPVAFQRRTTPVSRRRGESLIGGGSSPPPDPGLPRRGRIPADTYPSLAAAGERGATDSGEGRAFPRTPVCRGAAASRRNLPQAPGCRVEAASRGSPRQATQGGSASLQRFWLSLPPNCRGAARRSPPLPSLRAHGAAPAGPSLFARRPPGFPNRAPSAPAPARGGFSPCAGAANDRRAPAVGATGAAHDDQPAGSRRSGLSGSSGDGVAIPAGHRRAPTTACAVLGAPCTEVSQGTRPR